MLKKLLCQMDTIGDENIYNYTFLIKDENTEVINKSEQ